MEGKQKKKERRKKEDDIKSKQDTFRTPLLVREVRLLDSA
jgi:hypothetical protein